jgi:hypothetical protein
MGTRVSRAGPRGLSHSRWWTAAEPRCILTSIDPKRHSRLLTRSAVGLLIVGGVLLIVSALQGSVATPPANRPLPQNAAQELPPDLVQTKPREVGTRTEAGRVALGFASAVENHGAGRLLVAGSRAPGEATMAAEQLIERADGTRLMVPKVGRIRFTRGKHNHWHYLRFDRYELRRASDYALTSPDRKSGFCLGDRYETNLAFRAKPRRAALVGQCRPDQPGALSVRQGISVGYGDDYPSYLEGQSIDITGLPAGRYVLVHRVNADRRLRETDYSNNASSILLSLRWPRGHAGQPNLDRIKNCPGTERCPP